MKTFTKILAMVLALSVTAALSVGLTTAYLQDQDQDVNVMTLGNVQIAQHEYQRADGVAYNEGEAGAGNGVKKGALVEYVQGQKLYPAVPKNNAATDYTAEATDLFFWGDYVYSGTAGNGLWNDSKLSNVMDKMVFVENTGKSDAYFRTLIAFECPKEITIGEPSQGAEIMINRNGSTTVYAWEEIGYIEVDDVRYLVMAATYQNALKPGNQAHPSLLQVVMTHNATNEDMELLGDTYEILVLSQAVQTAGFGNATTALDTAFGDDNEENAAKWFGGVLAGQADTWDGTIDTTWYNDTDTTFTLSTAEEIVGLAQLANEGNTFSRKTIVLDYNIDLNNQQWTPIKKFAGTLDGNNHTISNYSIDATAGNGGLINVLEWGTVSDLTLSNVTATVGGYRFGVLANKINQSNIDNVTVRNVNVTTTSPSALVAGIFATGTVNSNMEVNNCTVENFTVNAETGADFIAGITTVVQKNGTEAEGTNIFENLNVKNFKVIVNDTDGTCRVGGLVGQTQSVWQNPRFNNCSVSGLDVTATGTVDVGGFICYPGSWTYAENCTTEGKIDVSGVTAAANCAGGFFGNYGWGDNVSKGDHKVTNCSADVDVTTKVASAGGFVGSGTNIEGRNKNITLIGCEAKGTVTLVEGGTANIGGFVGQTDRGIYVNCSAAQAPFIGKVLDGYTLTDDGAGTLTVSK